MNSGNAQSPAAPLLASTAPAPRRRGRPRSPVFGYFHRLVDDKGVFQGNQCQFCPFVSRDRSENPTYLTRHLLRTCSAPQSVKDEMGVRHPSIAISAFGGSKRYNSLKQGPVIAVASAPLLPLSVTQPQGVTSTVRRGTGTVGAKRPHGQGSQKQKRSHRSADGEPRQFLQGEELTRHPVQNEHCSGTQADIPLTHARQCEHDFRHSADALLPDTIPNTLQVGDLEAPKEPPTKDHQQNGELQDGLIEIVRPTVPDQQPPLDSTGDGQSNEKERSGSEGGEHFEQLPKSNENSGGMGSTPQQSSDVGDVGKHVSNFSDPPKAVEPIPARPTDSSHRVGLPSSQTLIRPAGVTKTRRGRPRSPALLHFRRHVDEKGTFIANQCMHCSFVSRDRSENSTLLLRHLLSQTCRTSEDVKIKLRRDTKGKRTGRAVKAGSKQYERMNARGGCSELKTSKNRGLPAGYLRNPDLVSSCLVRFFTAFDVNLNAVGSEEFKDMILAISSAEATNPIVRKEINGMLGCEEGSSDPSNGQVKFLPTENELNAFWRNMTSSQILRVTQRDQNAAPNHLLIHFPRHLLPEKIFCSQHDNSDSRRLDFSGPGLIASVFRWISSGRLEYLGSRNCAGDFAEHLNVIVEQYEAQCFAEHSKFDHILISRPFGTTEKRYEIPRNNPDNVWIPDVAREVDMLCHELLAQVPLLVSCVRRNRLIASFFREQYGESAAAVLFGENHAEKEVYRRYQTYISELGRTDESLEVLRTAVETYKVLCHFQTRHENPQKLQETGRFLNTMTEESVGCVPLCKEVTQFMYSKSYRKELKAFISFMKPLADLISKYSGVKFETSLEDMHFVEAGVSERGMLRDKNPFQCRSIAYLLSDCVCTLKELYSDAVSDHDSDLRVLRSHAACRLLGKSDVGNPPIVHDICYVAAFLNPYADLSASQDFSVEQAWRQAVTFLHNQYSANCSIAVDKVLDQLQSFHRRTGIFAAQQMFEISEDAEDPRAWWAEHGSVAPDLSAVANKVLSAPTSAFRCVEFISSRNAMAKDLRAEKRDELEEKRRFTLWNLKLLSQLRRNPLIE